MTPYRLLWWMIPVLLLACWLGAHNLNADPIWSDEYDTINTIGGLNREGRSFPGVWNFLADNDPWQAPGYFLLLALWQRVAGWEPPVLRALSLFLGLVSIAWTYRLGAALSSRRVGLLAAAIMASSAFFAHYLHEMRPYTLYTLLAVATLWLYVRLIRPKRKPRRWEWAALGLMVTAMLYTHYFAALPLGAIGLYHLLAVRKVRHWWHVVGAMAAGGLLFLPWVRVLIAGLDRTAADTQLHERALSGADAFIQLVVLFSNGQVVLLAALVVLALVLGWRERGLRTVVILALALLGLLLLTNETLKLMHGGRLRYLIALWPLLSVLVALGLLYLSRWRPVLIGVLALWLAGGVWAEETGFTEGLDGSAYAFPFHVIAPELTGVAQPGDVVVNVVPDAGLDAVRYEKIADYYYVPLGLAYVMTSPRSDYDHVETLAKVVTAHDRIWIAYNSTSGVAALEWRLATTEAFASCTLAIRRPEVVVDLYARSVASCPNQAGTSYTDDD